MIILMAIMLLLIKTTILIMVIRKDDNDNLENSSNNGKDKDYTVFKIISLVSFSQFVSVKYTFFLFFCDHNHASFPYQ